jgi:hypothetical protein
MLNIMAWASLSGYMDAYTQENGRMTRDMIVAR